MRLLLPFSGSSPLPPPWADHSRAAPQHVHGHCQPPPVVLALADHEELAAAEAFNREMAELEDLEHQEELRSLLQDRISGEDTVPGSFLENPDFVTACLNEHPRPLSYTAPPPPHRSGVAVLMSASAKQRQCAHGAQQLVGCSVRSSPSRSRG